MKIDWLGHDATRITSDNLVIYFDPYKIGNAPPADIILISHDHYDHLSPVDIEKLLKDDTVIVAPPECTPPRPQEKIAAGEKITVRGIEIEAVPAYNIGKDFHPKAAGGLGFIIQVEGKRIYHAGDTDLIPEMDGIQCDIALLPVSGTYVMTAKEAAEAARRIKPEKAIPVHYGAGVVGTVEDAKTFASLLKDSGIDVEIKEKVE